MFQEHHIQPHKERLISSPDCKKYLDKPQQLSELQKQLFQSKLIYKLKLLIDSYRHL